MYPSAMCAFNVGKDTKLATVLRIDNTKRRGLIQFSSPEDLLNKVNLVGMDVPGLKTYDVNDFFLDAIYTEANAMFVAQRFGLPSFDGIDAWMAKNCPQIHANAVAGTPVEVASAR